MGKAALFMVLSSTIILIGVSTSRLKSQQGSAKTQVEYEEKVLAREAVNSFFNILTAESVKNFDDYRSQNDDISYGDAALRFSAVGNSTDEIGLSATAMVGNAWHTVTGNVVRTTTSLVDAVTIDGPISAITADGSKFLITGIDTNPLGEVGSGRLEPTYGIRTTSAQTALAITDKIDGSQISGKYGYNSMTIGESEIDLDALYGDILSFPYKVVLNGKQKFVKKEVFGSPDSPIVLVVNGDFEMGGTAVGYGVLLVNGGKIKMRDAARWEGLVYGLGDGKKYEFKDNSGIYGALIMRSIPVDGSQDGTDLGLPGGHFDVDVFNGPTTNEIYHEHQYDDKYDRTFVDLLSTGCKTNGGLCWENIVAGGGFTNVRVQILNPQMSSGNLNFETDTWSTDPAQSPTAGIDRIFNVAELNAFRVTFAELCAMRGTQPGNVQGDAANRDGAFSVRIYDEESAGKPLIYELSVYHHIPKDYAGCGGTEGDGSAETIPGNPLELAISGESKLFFSSKTLARVTNLIPSLDLESEIIRIEGVRNVIGERILQPSGEYITRQLFSSYEDVTVTNPAY